MAGTDGDQRREPGLGRGVHLIGTARPNGQLAKISGLDDALEHPV